MKDVQNFEFIRLRLYRISIRSSDQASQFSKLQFIPFVAIDILEAIQAHACYYFSILDQELGNTKLLLWVINWNSEISLNNGLMKPRRALKVLFIDTRDFEKPRIESIMNNWRESGKETEQLIYQLDCCQELTEKLKQSNRRLPPHMRRADNFDVGFIPIELAEHSRNSE